MVWPFSDKRSLPEKVKAGAKLNFEEWRQLSFIEGIWPDAGGGPNTPGVVSVSRALALVPVFGAVRTIADSIASLTPCLYTRDSRGLLQRQPTPSLFAQPSIHGTMYDWLFRAATSMCLNGDAIGLITATDFYNFPTMIEWLNPEQVATQDGKMYGPGSYMNPMWWWWGRPIDPKQLLHIPWFSMPWKVRGLSPIGAYALAINTGIGAQEFQANWFGMGGVPPGTFKNAERIIDPVDADKLSNRLTARIQSKKPLVYGRDWEYTPIAIKPHEAQFIECAVGSTQFSMADGTLRRADKLRIGDKVISWDGERLVASRVSSAVKMPVGPTVRVVAACGREVVTSPNHPYLVDDNWQWITAVKLRPGNDLRVVLDGDVRLTRVTAVEDAGDQVTYGITVEGTHTHITNGIITHNTMQLTGTHIAVIYGLPPRRLGGTTGESMTYSTVELDNLDYLTISLRPWLRRFEYAFTRCFPRGQFVKFDTDDMLLLDAKTRTEIDNISLGFQNNGWKTEDEVRASRDMAPLVQPKQAPVKWTGSVDPPEPVAKPPVAQPGTNGGKPTSDGREQISTTNHALSGQSPRSMTHIQRETEMMRTRWDSLNGGNHG